MTWLPASSALTTPPPKRNIEQIINKSTLCIAISIFIAFCTVSAAAPPPPEEGSRKPSLLATAWREGTSLHEYSHYAHLWGFLRPRNNGCLFSRPRFQQRHARSMPKKDRCT